ncbi:MAG: DNA polymerase I [Candidatus Caenarcaniphilales bacterium]|nr:DNA polymerase I [Candidatus Caenarcaniphilales bacterium]
MSKKQSVLLVDGSNLAFRMYFALEYTGLSAPSGKPSWAIFGFFKALLDVIEKEKPTAIIAAFDSKEPTFRHEAFDYYKANRPEEMPEALAEQWPEILRGLEYMGLNPVHMPGFEADDLIGTLALQAERENWEVLILSGDKDNFQLVSDQISILMPATGGIRKMGRAEVKAKMGVYPEQVIDFKALSGDSSDNIPGVPGIGEKTAVKLLEEFGTLEDIYANLDKLKSKSQQSKLLSGRSSAIDSKFLATIKTDCPIAYEFDRLAHKPTPKLDQLSTFLEEYRLASLQRRLPQIFPGYGQVSLFQQNGDGEIKNAISTKTLETQTILSVDESYSSSNYQDPPWRILRELITDEVKLQQALQELKSSRCWSIDLETDGLNTRHCQIVGWALAWLDPDNHNTIKSAYIPTGHDYLSAPDQLSNESVTKLIKTTSQSTIGKLYIQNIKFEYKILKRYGWEVPASALDTMLASYLDDPDQSHGLKNQVRRIFGYQMQPIEELIGPKGKNQKSMNQIEIERVYLYACDDAAYTLALGEHYQHSLTEAQSRLWAELESPLAFLIAQIEEDGVYVNSSDLNKLSKELTARSEILEEKIRSEFRGSQINLNSSQQLAEALQAYGFQLSKVTTTGQWATDNNVLTDLKEQNVPCPDLIDWIIEYRLLNKLRSTYTDSLHELIDPSTKRLHGEFNQALTSTGRLSSSNPNLQNIPVKNQQFGMQIRACFQAEPGYKLLSADYSQIELRILAHYTKDPTLLDAFRSRQDIHQRTASEIFDCPTDQVTSDMRRLGKTLNFALIYQQGAFATARQLGISIKEANAFIEKYFQSFPLVKPFMEQTLDQVRSQGYAETIWGRRRYFKEINSRSTILRKAQERQAFNAPLQGSAADLMKMAMLRVVGQIKQKKLNAKLILQVHDEIVLEVKADQTEDLSEILEKEMMLDQPLLVPIEVHICSGSNWAECK